MRDIRKSPAYMVVAGAIVGFLAASFLVPIFGVDLNSSSGGDATLSTGSGVDLGDGGGGFVGGGGGTDGLGTTTGDTTGSTGGGLAGGGGTGSAGGGSTGGGGTSGGTGGGGTSGGTGGGGSTGGETTQPTSPPVGSEQPVASDTGLTPTTIRIGVVLLDLGGAAALGVDGGAISTQAQMEEAEAFAKEINDAGGIFGRKIQLFFEKYDPVADATGSTTAQNACIRFTEDIKVFAVYANEGGWPANQCVTKQHNTLMFYSGVTLEDDTTPANGKGLMWTTRMLLIKQSANAMALAKQMGELSGKRIGLMYDEGTGGGRAVATERGIIPALVQLGIARNCQNAAQTDCIAAEVKLSGDPGTASSQIPVAVNQFRANNAQIVVVASQVVYIAQWVNQSRSSGYNPRYIMTGDAANDFTGQQGGGGGQFNALAIADADENNKLAGRPENPKRAECNRRWTAITGRPAPEEGDPQIGRISNICTIFDELKRAMINAGVNPTMRAVSQQLEARGEFPSGAVGLSRWGVGDYGGAEVIRAGEWDGSCNDRGCFLPVTDYYAGPF